MPQFGPITGLHWTKPPLNLIPFGAGPGRACSRIGRGPCVVDRPATPCLNGSLAGGDLLRANLTLAQAVARCRGHPRCAGFTTGSSPGGCPANGTILDVHFKDSWGS